MANYSRVGREFPGAVVTTGNPDTVNDSFPSTTSVGASYDLRGQLGAIFRSNDGLKEWIYAQFSSTSTGKTPAANQVCYWVANSTANLASPGSWVVDNQTSANSGVKVTQPAGILRVACTRGNGVWLLRKAPSASVVSTTTGFVTGDVVVCTTASGEASFVSSTSTIAPATGVGATPWFNLGGDGRAIGVVNSTTTSSVAIDVALDIR